MAAPKRRNPNSSSAGKMLSRYIRMIAEEETEFVKDDDGVDKMATKAEAMARNMWKIALGWTEYATAGDGGPPIETVHPPDLKMMQLLYDRMEGRAQTAAEDDSFRPSTAQKITEQGQRRIAQAGELANG